MYIYKPVEAKKICAKIIQTNSNSLNRRLGDIFTVNILQILHR